MTRPARIVSTALAVVVLASLAAVSVPAQPKPLRPWTLILDFVPTGEYVPHYTAL